VKPVSFEQLEQAAERILAQARSQAEAGRPGGHAPPWLRALERARQAAASDADVLIEAESGTGKELVARLIHRLSPRRDRAFVPSTAPLFPRLCWKANCSAMPGELSPGPRGQAG
jgi:DNA-binding NtrC family response regulator